MTDNQDMKESLRERARKFSDRLWWDEIVPHLNVDTSHDSKCKFNYEWEHIAKALLSFAEEATNRVREDIIRECAELIEMQERIFSKPDSIMHPQQFSRSILSLLPKKSESLFDECKQIDVAIEKVQGKKKSEDSNGL